MNATMLQHLTKETEARYAERTATRRLSQASVQEGRVLDADSRRRVDLRLARLKVDRRLAEAVSAGEVPSSGAPVPSLSDSIALERVLGHNDLMPISFLQRGGAVSETVGRITIRLADGRRGFGSGFFVGPRVLMTNNHVLDSAQTALRSFVEFNYESLHDGQLDDVGRFDFAPSELFITDPVLDFTVVALAAPEADLEPFGWNRLIGEEGKVIIGERLNIIQHPNGELKQLALRENTLVDVLPDFLHYRTDTAPGSSGSPVFNDQWEVVALHHSGVPERDDRQRILATDGQVWHPSMGDHRIKWIANEGARVSRIVAALRAAPLSRSAAAVLARIFDAALPTPEGKASTDRAAAGAAYSMGADGVATWRIPLTVSVSLGVPGMAAPTTPQVGPGPPHMPSAGPATPLPGPAAAPEGRNIIVTNRMVQRLLASASGREFRAQIEESTRRGTLTETAFPEDPDVDPKELAAFAAEWDQALAALESASADVDDEVLFSAQNQLSALMQSTLAERLEAGGTLESAAAGGVEGLELKFATNDWWGWFRSLFSWVARKDYHPLLRPASAQPETLGDRARLALFSDWGTGLYGAPEIARSIKDAGGFDLVMHLGDVYYAGTSKEMQTRFLGGWPFGAGRLNRGLNSNHDMYSGGHAYFGVVLPRFAQASSYFALQNTHWTLIGLDTAYVDFDLDDQQVAWLESVLASAGDRRTVLFSHHQLFSRLDKQGPKLRKALAGLLEDKRIDLWYWGHEHRCVIYDEQKTFGLRARCIGHGGIPQKRDGVQDGKVTESVGDYRWRRLTAKNKVPASVALDGPNRHIDGKEDKYLPHGYVTLEFDEASLVERYWSADGEELFRLDH